MTGRRLTNERGTAVLLTLGFMIFLLAMVGFAVDIAYQMAAIGELERSMEAAALAGAGKLGFDDTVFPTVRQTAQQYGLLNPHHNTPFGSLINLNLNTSNAANGNIIDQARGCDAMFEAKNRISPGSIGASAQDQTPLSRSRCLTSSER